MKTIKLISLMSLILVGAGSVFVSVRAERPGAEIRPSATPTPGEKVWLEYEPAVVDLEGKLVVKTFYGPPNFGENPETDTKETGPYLKLTNPINVRGKSGDSIDGNTFENVRLVQLVLEQPYKKMIGKTVHVKGTLFGAHTGHHHADVLMSVREIEIVRSLTEGVQLIRTDTVNIDGFGSGITSTYVVRAESLRLAEIRASSSEKAEMLLDSRVRSLGKCNLVRGLNYGTKQVGRLFNCSNGSEQFVLYSYGQKFYEISAAFGDTISRFTSIVLPMACQLNDSDECISMYY